MTQTDLDDRIDAVVREMLDVEARPDLGARVLERIAEPERRSLLRWVMVPIAVAALVVLAVAGPWRVWQRASPVVGSTSLARIVPAVRASLPRNVNRQPGDTVRIAEARGAAASAPRFAPPDAPSVDVAPLDQLEAIRVPPVAVTRLNGPQVAIAPLPPIEQIEVQPVGPPEGRN